MGLSCLRASGAVRNVRRSSAPEDRDAARSDGALDAGSGFQGTRPWRCAKWNIVARTPRGKHALAGGCERPSESPRPIRFWVVSSSAGFRPSCRARRRFFLACVDSARNPGGTQMHRSRWQDARHTDQRLLWRIGWPQPATTMCCATWWQPGFAGPFMGCRDAPIHPRARRGILTRTMFASIVRRWASLLATTIRSGQRTAGQPAVSHGIQNR